MLDAEAHPVQSPQNIYYCHRGAHCAQAGRASIRIVADEEPNCAFANFEAIEQDSDRLWRCYDVAFRSIAGILTANMKAP